MSRNMWRTDGRLNFPLYGLVLYLPLWHPELSGSPIISKDTNQHSCTFTGTTHVPPTHRTFDGTDDKVSIPDHADLSALGAFTFLIWAKLDSGASGAVAGLFNKDDAGAKREFQITTNAADKQQVFLASDGSNYLVARGTNTVADDKFHLWTLSWSGVNATTQISILLDDVAEVLSVDNKQGGGYVPHDTDRPIEIARTSEANSECWEGDIGEVWAYIRDLSTVDKTHIFNKSKWRYV